MNTRASTKSNQDKTGTGSRAPFKSTEAPLEPPQKEPSKRKLDFTPPKANKAIKKPQEPVKILEGNKGNQKHNNPTENQKGNISPTTTNTSLHKGDPTAQTKNNFEESSSLVQTPKGSQIDTTLNQSSSWDSPADQPNSLWNTSQTPTNANANNTLRDDTPPQSPERTNSMDITTPLTDKTNDNNLPRGGSNIDIPPEIQEIYEFPKYNAAFRISEEGQNAQMLDIYEELIEYGDIDYIDPEEAQKISTDSRVQDSFYRITVAIPKKYPLLQNPEELITLLTSSSIPLEAIHDKSTYGNIKYKLTNISWVATVYIYSQQAWFALAKSSLIRGT
jgi:hypothetical protein